jgi:hypothetical protein
MRYLLRTNYVVRRMHCCGMDIGRGYGNGMMDTDYVLTSIYVQELAVERAPRLLAVEPAIPKY